MSGSRTWRLAAGCALFLSVLGARPRHPMHLSLTEIVIDARSGAVTVTSRLFADDLAAAVARGRHGPLVPGDVADSRYLTDNVRMRSEDGVMMRLESCGVTRRADLVWICARSRVSGTREVELTNRLLFEIHDDQINMVQLTTGSRRQSALFRRGAETKRLPIR